VELINGEIAEMSPQGSPHYVAITLVTQALARAFGEEYWVRPQGPLALFEASEPEPDIAVVRGNPRTMKGHPTRADLIVEISDTSLAFDLGAKASLYASAGIADYWVVDLQGRRVIVHRAPAAHPGSDFGHRYTEVRPLDASASIVPLAATHASIK